MRFLIDTHILIWFLERNSSLAAEKRDLIVDASSDVSVSIASLWELAVKLSLRKIRLSRTLSDVIGELAALDISQLDIRPRHVLAIEDLPFHHKDPFDRMIIAQAMVEQIPIITADPTFQNYGVQVL